MAESLVFDQDRDGRREVVTAWFLHEEAPATEADMAKAAPADPVIVARYADALSAAGRERSDFERILSALKRDKEVRRNDIIAIALAYRGGGTRPRSKQHAIEMIEKRFVEMVLDARRSDLASRVRPW